MSTKELDDRRAYSRAYYALNRDRISEQRRQARQADPERFREYRRKYRASHRRLAHPTGVPHRRRTTDANRRHPQLSDLLARHKMSAHDFAVLCGFDKCPSAAIHAILSLARPPTLREQVRIMRGLVALGEPVDISEWWPEIDPDRQPMFPEGYDAELATACATPIASEEDKQLLEEAIEKAGLTKQERTVIRLRSEGMTCREIGSDHIHRTCSRVQQVVVEAEQKIREYIYGRNAND